MPQSHGYGSGSGAVKHDQPQARLQRSLDKDQKPCLPVRKCREAGMTQLLTALAVVVLYDSWPWAQESKPLGRRDKEDTTRCLLCLYKFS